ncbi:hypothetical protein F5890DRAFT_1474228 [Lentinula detonsa]|uniref:Transposase n=1 Tax=Lentinula detonsa TaxID=2804962 RepID=A0AA38UTR7_9AGAR|nr:hypothetical protein F5890DRAFT_1474228 [Lentinula detonsa]
MTRGQKLSDDLQNTLIHLRKTCKTLNEIVEKSNCKKRTIQRVLSHHRKKDQNHLGIGIELRGRKRIISFEDLQFIHGLLLHTPDMYLDEIQHHLDERRGVLAAITKVAIERDDLKRAQFRLNYARLYSADQLVFVDESSFDRRTPYRRRGWALFTPTWSVSHWYHIHQGGRRLIHCFQVL